MYLIIEQIENVVADPSKLDDLETVDNDLGDVDDDLEDVVVGPNKLDDLETVDDDLEDVDKDLGESKLIRASLLILRRLTTILRK